MEDLQIDFRQGWMEDLCRAARSTEAPAKGRLSDYRACSLAATDNWQLLAVFFVAMAVIHAYNGVKSISNGMSRKDFC
ncbi:MAG: hypothetical protein EHM33_23820 [Chloroflexi bacterium]|nr:MAG: hypothetical protein EHM33_23820 [Chloroflexota bacterium]